jgi:hypothetical protein
MAVSAFAVFALVMGGTVTRPTWDPSHDALTRRSARWMPIRRLGLCFGDTGVQSFADLLRRVGAAAPLLACDHHAGGGNAYQPGHA